MWYVRIATVVTLVLLFCVGERRPHVILFGHRDSVTNLAVTELDGRKVVVSASVDKTVRLWDVAGREEIRRLAVRNVVIQTMAVADVDGRQVAVVGASDQSLRLWDLRTGEETFLSEPVEDGYFFRFEDMVIATIDDRTVAMTTGLAEGVEFWDLVAAERLRKTALSTDFQQVMVGSPGKRLLALYGSDTLTIPEGSLPEWLTPSSVRSPRRGSSMGIAEIDGHLSIMAVEGDTVTFWKPDAVSEWLRSGREITWSDASITDFAVTEVDGRPTMILAADKGMAAWDLTRRRQVSDTVLAGGRELHIAVTEMNGEVVVVAGSSDGRIYLQPLDL